MNLLKRRRKLAASARNAVHELQPVPNSVNMIIERIGRLAALDLPEGERLMLADMFNRIAKGFRDSADGYAIAAEALRKLEIQMQESAR